LLSLPAFGSWVAALISSSFSPPFLLWAEKKVMAKVFLLVESLFSNSYVRVKIKESGDQSKWFILLFCCFFLLRKRKK
jgi:hypothetical protein